MEMMTTRTFLLQYQPPLRSPQQRPQAPHSKSNFLAAAFGAERMGEKGGGLHGTKPDGLHGQTTR